MIKDNTKRINYVMAKSLAGCFFAIIALLVTKYAGIFEFEKTLVWSIAIAGTATTLFPIILYKINVPDEFLKYYMMISVSLFIGLLGTYNGIGIYITFVLVPVASCLYFDRFFTKFCSGFSYVIMVISVYMNSAGKLEITYKKWSHIHTFQLYIIGFTIEYLIIALFVTQIMRRAVKLINEQHEAYLKAKSQDYRYELLIEGTEDVIFEYFVDTKEYKANRSVYSPKGSAAKSIDKDNISDDEAYIKIQSLINDLINKSADDSVRDLEVDLSYELNGIFIPLWYNFECFLVKDGERLVSVIGKLHDITKIKLAQERRNKERVSDMYIDSIGDKRNSIYNLVMSEETRVTEKDIEMIAEGHRFVAQIMEACKYSTNLRESLSLTIESVAKFFKLDRMAVLEIDITDGTTVLSYQWSDKAEDMLVNFMPHLSKEDIDIISDIYNKYGYIEVNPDKNIFTFKDDVDEKYKNIVTDVMLGTQLWIPTMSDAKYTGAFIFDKYDTTPFTIGEKFLLSEVVNNLSAIIDKINAEEANVAKSNFLSTMSHEIRTPMNAIVGLTEVALREDMSEDVRKCLKTVQSSSFGLLALINDILDYSKAEAGKFDIVPENYQVLSMVNDANEIIKARNNGKLNLALHIDENMPSVLNGDQVRIKQVMINFCTNAIKYSDKGTVDISLSFEKTGDKKGNLLFSVKDEGIGIKKEDLPKLFKSYGQVDQQVNHHKEGTGLGLAISKQLIDLMEGRVNVESEYGKGSTFSFLVPQTIVNETKAGRLEEFAREDEEEEIKIFTAPEAKILIVDDTKINLMVAKALFKPLNMQIETASDGFEALSKIESNIYDLILMDHFMPGMDGVETTNRIRQMEGNPNQNVPIIALTADAMSGVKEELLSKGMNDFLAKPIIIKLAVPILKKWLPKDKIKE